MVKECNAWSMHGDVGGTAPRPGPPVPVPDDGAEPGPDLSVVIVTPDRYETIRKTMGHLRAQTVRDRIEIVIAAPSKDALGLDESELRDFFQSRVIEVGAIRSTARVRAAGIGQAAAPVVALVEDHAYPAPGWAEALIEAHRQPWAAVGPVIGNANPRTLTSWANLIIEYGPWLDPVPAGPVEHIPGHNSSYKRAALMEYGDRLEAMLDAETVLHWELRACGQQLVIEPAAKTFHYNFSRIGSSVPLRFNGGRLFAAARCRHWPVVRRLLYFIAGPLIPLVRLFRLVGEMRRPGRLPWRALPLMFVGLLIDGFGEMIGYLSGAGDAMAKLTDMEFHRDRYLTVEDRQQFLAIP